MLGGIEPSSARGFPLLRSPPIEPPTKKTKLDGGVVAEPEVARHGDGDVARDPGFGGRWPGRQPRMLPAALAEAAREPVSGRSGRITAWAAW